MIPRTVLFIFSLALSSGFHLCPFSKQSVSIQQTYSSYPPSSMRVVTGSDLPSVYTHNHVDQTKKRVSLGLRSMDTRLMFARNQNKIENNENDKEITTNGYSDLRASYLALGALLFTFISNQWARQSIYYLCDFSPDATSFKHINIGNKHALRYKTY